jgi:predicted CXXCH cytochrome family protein
VLYCIDCHSVAGEDPAVAGPHTSNEAPILKSPYLGALPSDADALCYDCHKYTTYYDLTSLEDTGTAASWFYDATAGPLHGLHVRDHGFGCASCHASHGSPVNERLVRDTVTFEVTADGGSCIGPCHVSPDGGTTPGVTYTR